MKELKSLIGLILHLFIFLANAIPIMSFVVYPIVALQHYGFSTFFTVVFCIIQGIVFLTLGWMWTPLRKLGDYTYWIPVKKLWMWLGEDEDNI